MMIIGDYPGYSETVQRESLIGATGEVLDRVFAEVGHPDYRSEFFFTNVCKYQPYKNIVGKLNQADIDALWREIEDIRPNVILTLGELPLQAVAGVKKFLLYRGSILPNEKSGYIPKVVPTIHPLHLTRASNASGDYYPDKKLYNGIWRYILQFDIAKALEQSRFADFRPPERHLKVATSSLDVIRLLERNRGRVPYIDVETYKST